MDGKCYGVLVEVGLKVSVRDCVLSSLKDNPHILQNFKLNIKRINRWWYSVYFDKICKHDAETLIFGDVVYCKPEDKTIFIGKEMDVSMDMAFVTALKTFLFERKGYGLSQFKSDEELCEYVKVNYPEVYKFYYETT